MVAEAQWPPAEVSVAPTVSTPGGGEVKVPVNAITVTRQASESAEDQDVAAEVATDDDYDQRNSG
ncbi:hypothetical protein IscW_ISCW006633 [Ixodes scapularis]|uniref:Uncharacterized protein n=1 Tax=Ixodes scapularis TaxID=6945 RepID=B7PKE4_IXOSC|nr:hypothetical protein IscW_ISCW006633 [Ixodes scapularis]|eukprot:XP_002399751.1 hypothetical protein IscW_ISCW006633 [Ixodes scapularis]